jgi:hypothetical protein
MRSEAHVNEEPTSAVTVNADDPSYCIWSEDFNDLLEDDLSLEILGTPTDTWEPSNGNTYSHPFHM